MEELSAARLDRLKMLENRSWLDTHFEEIQSAHCDKWIAILDQQVVASHHDVSRVHEAVLERLGEAIIIRIPKQAVPQPI